MLAVNDSAVDVFTRYWERNQARDMMTRKPPKIPDSVGAEYIAGVNAAKLEAKYKTSWPRIRAKLISLGIAIRSRGFPDGIARTRPRKVSAKGRQEIGELHTQGVLHPEIAKRFGITRERVRQIVAILGLPERIFAVRQMASDRRKQKNEERAEEAEERRGRIEAASELWKRHAHWTTIAEVMGWKCTRIQAFHSALCGLRKRHGEAAFPVRRPNHWNRQRPESRGS